jgi:hypothetical protein
MTSLTTADITPPQKPKLLDRLRDAIRLRHYSIRTEQAYLQWVRRFIIFHKKRHPDEMGPPEVEAFLTHLAVEGRVAAATQNQSSMPSSFSIKSSSNATLDSSSIWSGPSGIREYRSS